MIQSVNANNGIGLKYENLTNGAELISSESMNYNSLKQELLTLEQSDTDVHLEIDLPEHKKNYKAKTIAGAVIFTTFNAGGIALIARGKRLAKKPAEKDGFDGGVEGFGNAVAGGFVTAFGVTSTIIGTSVGIPLIISGKKNKTKVQNL